MRAKTIRRAGFLRRTKHTEAEGCSYRGVHRRHNVHDTCRGSSRSAAGNPSQLSIPPEKLISLAQDVYKQNSGVDNPDVLASDFRFEFPVVSLAKEVRLL